MAQSLSMICIHAVFSSKNRINFLTEPLRRELFPYTATVLKTLECPAIEVGGVDNHLHLLFMLGREIAIADLIEEVKKPTSKWLKRKGAAYGKFSWQNGHGAFSVSMSVAERVQAYIRNQAEHHGKRTYEEEFIGLLKKHRVEYDPRYVFD